MNYECKLILYCVLCDVCQCRNIERRYVYFAFSLILAFTLFSLNLNSFMIGQNMSVYSTFKPLFKGSREGKEEGRIGCFKNRSRCRRNMDMSG